jgi:hypothetical protein
MSRRVITTQLQATGAAAATVDGYFDKVIKYIPSDIVGAWIFASSAIKAASGVPVTASLWTAFAVLLAITPFWTWRWTKFPGKPAATTQITISTIAFAVWVFALGGPFATMAFYRPLYGSLILILYSLLAAMINPRDPRPAVRRAAA